MMDTVGFQWVKIVHCLTLHHSSPYYLLTQMATVGVSGVYWSVKQFICRDWLMMRVKLHRNSKYILWYNTT